MTKIISWLYSITFIIIAVVMLGFLAYQVGYDYAMWMDSEKDKRELSDDRFIVDACGLHFYERDDGYVRVLDRRKD